MTGSVLFLEEDHYVSPDLLYVLNKMKEYKQKNKIDAQVYVLGNYLKTYSSNMRNIVSSIRKFYLLEDKMIINNFLKK